MASLYEYLGWITLYIYVYDKQNIPLKEPSDHGLHCLQWHINLFLTLKGLNLLLFIWICIHTKQCKICMVTIPSKAIIQHQHFLVGASKIMLYETCFIETWTNKDNFKVYNFQQACTIMENSFYLMISFDYNFA